MPQIDIPVKRLMQIRLEDWVEYLIPNCNKDCSKQKSSTSFPISAKGSYPQLKNGNKFDK